MTGTPPGPGHNGGLIGAIAHVRRKQGELRRVLSRRKVYRKTQDELWLLSDGKLSDLGIHRDDIERLARETAYDR